VGAFVTLNKKIAYLLTYIAGTAGPIFTKFCMQLCCDRGSVVLWRPCDMLCISGFMDDVMFGRNEPYGVAWPAWSATRRQLRARPGRCLMSMNTCKLFEYTVDANDVRLSEYKSETGL